jgi:hypothetical protein
MCRLVMAWPTAMIPVQVTGLHAVPNFSISTTDFWLDQRNQVNAQIVLLKHLKLMMANQV